MYWLRFVRKPLYRHIYMYMGYIRPIQALHTYICMLYICLLPSFGCGYALYPLHIPFWHVASFRPTSIKDHVLEESLTEATWALEHDTLAYTHVLYVSRTGHQPHKP